MQSKLPKLMAALMLACGLIAANPAAAETDGLFGVWANPKRTVQVDIRPCGASGACGFIVWASDDAKADARKAGTSNLIGLQIFRDLRQDKNGAWIGKVFAPDLGMTFAGNAKLIDAGSLRAKGCILGGLICKSQRWTRA